MSESASCDCADCCKEAAPVFLEGGGELAVELREVALGVLLRDRRPVPPDELAELVGPHSPSSTPSSTASPARIGSTATRTGESWAQPA